MTGDEARVRLPPDLRAKCERRIEGTNFDSVEEYVQFVMVTLLDADDEGTATDDEGTGADTRTDTRTDDSDAVTDRLESLGYL
jgi:hypothetical protein